MSIELGDSAPKFALRNQHGEQVRLSGWRGRQAVLLVFYPLSFSGVCTKELATLQSEIAFFRDHGTEVIAVSVDSMYVQRVFADQQGLDFPVLADFWPHGEVARAYGVFDESRGVALRGTFLVDEAGVVRWKVEHAIPDARDVAQYMKAVASL